MARTVGPRVGLAVVALLLPCAGAAATPARVPPRAPDSTSVPMEVREGRAVVAVMLQGRGPYRLAVETGSPNTLLSPAVLRDLGLSPMPATGGGGEEPAFRLDSLAIGAIVVHALAVGSFDLDQLDVDGVLGWTRRPVCA